MKVSEGDIVKFKIPDGHVRKIFKGEPFAGRVFVGVVQNVVGDTIGISATYGLDIISASLIVEIMGPKPGNVVKLKPSAKDELQGLFAYLSQRPGLAADVVLKCKSFSGKETRIVGCASIPYSASVGIAVGAAGKEEILNVYLNTIILDSNRSLVGYVTSLWWSPIVTCLPAEVQQLCDAIDGICEVGRFKGEIHKVFGVNYTDSYHEDSGSIIGPLYPSRKMAEIALDAHKQKTIRRYKRHSGAKIAKICLEHHRWDIVELEIVYQLK